jgi:hypothetical protein
LSARSYSSLDAHIREGAHGTMVVFADRYTKKGTDADGNDVEREIPFLKAYTAFNIAQIEGLPTHYYAEPETQGGGATADRQRGEVLRCDRRRHPSQRQYGVLRARREGDPTRQSENRTIPSSADLFVKALLIVTIGARILGRRSGRRSAMRRATPPRRRTSWRTERRLDRDFGGKRFGDTGYAREELVAELAPRSCARISASRPSRARTTRRTSRTGSRSSAKISAQSSRPPRTRSAPSIFSTACKHGANRLRFCRANRSGPHHKARFGWAVAAALRHRRDKSADGKTLWEVPFLDDLLAAFT